MKLLFYLIIILIINGCSYEYACVTIKTINQFGQTPSLKIMDAKSGLAIGNRGITPILTGDYLLVKKKGSTNSTLSLIVYDKCYPIVWSKPIEITHWTKDQALSTHAEYSNDIIINVVKDTTCN